MADIGAVLRFINKVEGAADVTKLGSSLDSLAGKVKALGAAYLSVAGAQKAWDIAKQGAAINQTRESFERMNREIFKTPDLLAQMQQASRGTISELQLMEGLLKLTAGASTDLAQQFGQAAPQLLEIAKAANKLNPSLGDTAFLYDSISTGIKRASPLILDNLGIVVKVGEANEKYAASLGKSVEALTAEEKQIALLNATLEAGGRLIDQVGGNVDSATDSYAQLETAIKEAFDVFKSSTATAAADQMKNLAGTAGDVTEAFKEAADALGNIFGGALGKTAAEIVSWLLILEAIQNGSIGDIMNSSVPNDPNYTGLMSWLDRVRSGEISGDAMWDEFFGSSTTRQAINEFVTGGEEGVEVWDVVADKIRETRSNTDAAASAGRAAGYEYRMAAAAAKEMAIATGAAAEASRTVITPEMERWRMEERESGFDPLAAIRAERAQANQEYQQALAEMRNEQIKGFIEDLSRQGDSFNAMRQDASDAYAHIRNEVALTEEELAAMGFTTEEIASVMARQGEAMAEAFDVIRERAAEARRNFVELIDIMQEDVTAALVAPAHDASFVIGGPSGEQVSLMEEYQKHYEKAAEKAFDLANGIGTAGKSQEEVNKALEKANTEMAHYAALMEGMDMPATQFGTAHKEMALNIDVARRAFFDMLVEAGASQDAIDSYGIAIGRFSEEEAKAARITQELMIKQQQLAQMVAEGVISAEDAERHWQGFFNILQQRFREDREPVEVPVVPVPQEVDQEALNNFWQAEVKVTPEPEGVDQEELNNYWQAEVNVKPTVASGVPWEDTVGAGVSAPVTVDVTTETDDAYRDISAWFDGGGDRVANFNIKTVDEESGFEIFRTQVDEWIGAPHELAVTANTDTATTQIHEALEQFQQYEIQVVANVAVNQPYEGNPVDNPTTSGGRAMGGPVGYGKSYIVGEQGPELFVPWANGNIVPNHKMRGGGAGGGRSIVVQFGDMNFYGPASPQRVNDAMERATDKIIRAVERAGKVA